MPPRWRTPLQRIDALQAQEGDAAALPMHAATDKAAGGSNAFAAAAGAAHSNGHAAAAEDGEEDEGEIDREGSIAAIVERSLQKAVEVRLQGELFSQWQAAPCAGACITGRRCTGLPLLLGPHHGSLPAHADEERAHVQTWLRQS